MQNIRTSNTTMNKFKYNTNVKLMIIYNRMQHLRNTWSLFVFHFVLIIYVSLKFYGIIQL